MHIALLLAAEAPLIDIDGTVFIQFALFCAMFVALYALLWKPFLAVQEERGRRIDGARKDAQAMAQRADAMLRDYEAELLKAKQRGGDERKRLRDEGLAQERDVLATTRAIGEKAWADAQQRIAGQRDVARTTLQAEGSAIGLQIAARILGRAIDPTPRSI